MRSAIEATKFDVLRAALRDGHAVEVRLRREVPHWHAMSRNRATGARTSFAIPVEPYVAAAQVAVCSFVKSDGARHKLRAALVEVTLEAHA